MRKFIKIFVIFTMLVSFYLPVKANQTTNLYVYTNDTSKFNEYAIKNVGLHMYCFNEYIDSSLKLGEGISLFGDLTYPIVLYPIWKNDEIVATYKVANVNGTFTGTYSDANAEELNSIKDLTSSATPLIIYVNDGTFGKIGTNVYNLNGINLSEYPNISIENEGLEIKDVSNCLEYEEISLTRAPVSYSNDWTTYYHDPSFTTHCYTFCLYNIFLNLGITQYSINEIRSGILIGLGVASIPSINSYLTSEGFTYSYATSGYTPIATVRNIIYNNDNYIMAGLTYITGDKVGLKHFMAMYGYMSVSGTNCYRVWDPQSTGTGKLVIDGSTMEVIDSNNVILKWNGGYIGSFDK